MDLQLNTILVNTGGKLLLIDAGSGLDGKFQKSAGALPANLAAAGYALGDIDLILLTHAHSDRAATDKTLVDGYHFPFPGFGHVLREGNSYRWLPADWQWTS